MKKGNVPYNKNHYKTYLLIVSTFEKINNVHSSRTSSRKRTNTKSLEQKRKISESVKKAMEDFGLRERISKTLREKYFGQNTYEPYVPDFNKHLKEFVRKRDCYLCQECHREQDELRTKTNKPYKLVIHHIDFNKKNNNPNNLISLCKSCHMKVLYDKEKWIKYYQNKVNERITPILFI